MTSLKRSFEGDDTVVATNPAGLTSRKFAKTTRLANEFAVVNAEVIKTHAAQVTPTAPAAPAPAPVTMAEDVPLYENEGSSKVSPDRLALHVSLSSR